MSESQFYTFLTGGLVLLIAVITLAAWHLWRMREEIRDGELDALEGISHELRINLQRMMTEISQVVATEEAGPDVLLPIRHPQLDGVNASMIRANRNAIAVIGATYQELEARKMALRAALAQGRDLTAPLDDAMDAVINGIATFYMWEVHDGVRPSEAGSVRSWNVRDWMKGHGFIADAFPGMHLRDEVVERLRAYGLHLTPRPLTHTAHEYYSMRYDRMADEYGPFGKRRKKKEAIPVVADTDLEADELEDEDAIEGADVFETADGVEMADEADFEEADVDDDIDDAEFDTLEADEIEDGDDLDDADLDAEDLDDLEEGDIEEDEDTRQRV